LLSLVLFFCAAVNGAVPQLSIAAATNGSVRVEWYGEGGVNYALRRSSDPAFDSGTQSTYHLGNQETLPVEEALSGERAFFRVEAQSASPGIGVATSGSYAGALVHYDESGAQAPLCAFGVNYYDAFTRYISDSNDTSFVEGFAYLQTNNIPVARVLCAGFWPKNWELYFSDRDEYFRRLDYFVEQAEEHEVGLIVDFFWAIVSVGELVDDAVDAGILVAGQDFTPPDPLNTNVYGESTYAEYKTALGRQDSGSNALIEHYTRELVERYAASPAIWGWEFGNEYNLGVDHPNMTAMRDRPGGPTWQGMMLVETTNDLAVLPAWTGPDDLTRADVLVAKQVFADTVRSIDTWRLIMSGDSSPRSSAYHNWTEHTWGMDTRTENGLVMPVDNPSPMDTVTVHFYPGSTNSSPVVYFPKDDPVTNQWLTGQYQELMTYYRQEAALRDRPLVVGEWGATGDGTTADEKLTFHRMVQALIDSDVQLSLLWTFDNRNSGQTSSWWVNPGTDKEYQLTNDDPDLWDLKQANQEHGQW
jgi:hypothetical protein